ncbi:hypothetical protein Ancab_010561 [Ancistrocladus abbreviatus]
MARPFKEGKERVKRKGITAMGLKSGLRRGKGSGSIFEEWIASSNGDSSGFWGKRRKKEERGAMAASLRNELLEGKFEEGKGKRVVVMGLISGLEGDEGGGDSGGGF